VLLVFKQELLLMSVLLLSVFMAVVINSPCAERSQSKPRRLFRFMFLQVAPCGITGSYLHRCGKPDSQFMSCQMLCFTIPFEMVLLIDESLEFMDLNFEVNRKVCALLG